MGSMAEVAKASAVTTIYAWWARACIGVTILKMLLANETTSATNVIVQSQGEDKPSPIRTNLTRGGVYP